MHAGNEEDREVVSFEQRYPYCSQDMYRYISYNKGLALHWIGLFKEDVKFGTVEKLTLCELEN